MPVLASRKPDVSFLLQICPMHDPNQYDSKGYIAILDLNLSDVYSLSCTEMRR